MFRKRSNPSPPLPEAGIGGDNILIGEDLDSKESYWLSLEDWRTHWHVPGAPGTGKTSLLEVLLRALIEQRQGLCLGMVRRTALHPRRAASRLLQQRLGLGTVTA